jgi:hypothetical protein
MAACGLYPSGPRVVAVIVDDDGRVDLPLLAVTDDERWELLGRVDAEHGLDCELVFPEGMLRHDTICRFALERRHPTLAAPNELVYAIRRAAALKRAHRTAAMIARLALVPPLRHYLRRIERIDHDSRQLPLPLL